MPFSFLPRVEKCCCCIPIKPGCGLIVLYRVVTNFNHTVVKKICADLHEEMTILLVFFNVLNYIAGALSIAAGVAFAVFGLCKPTKPITADAFIVSVLGYDVLKLIYGFFAFLRLSFYEIECPMFSGSAEDGNVTTTTGPVYLRYTETTYDLIKASESTWRNVVSAAMPSHFAVLLFVPSILLDAYFMMVVNTYARDMPVPETESPEDDGGDNDDEGNKKKPVGGRG